MKKEFKQQVVINSKKPDKILIVGYYGMGNLGAEVRLKVIVDDIRKVNSNAQITIASFKYNDVIKIENAKYIYLKNVMTAIFEIIFKLFKYDYVIVGEGIPFVDFCGTGFLNYLIPILFFAQLFRKKTACYSFDIDNLKPLHRVITFRVLEKTNLLLVRTKKSLDYFKKYGFKNKIYVGTDCSFLFKSPRLKTKDKIIGFCLKDFYCYPIKCKIYGNKKDAYHYPLSYTYADNGKCKYRRFIHEISYLIDFFLKRDKKLKIKLIVMEHQMDYNINLQIYNNLKNKKRVELISSKTYTMEYMKSCFSTLKCLIAARYHSILLSLEYKIPTLVLSTDERFDYFEEELGLNRFLINVYENDIDMTQIYDFIKTHSSNKKLFSDKISKALPILEKKAEQNYLFFKKLFKK